MEYSLNPESILNNLQEFPNNITALVDLSHLLSRKKITEIEFLQWIKACDNFLKETNGRGNLEIKKELISSLNKKISSNFQKHAPELPKFINEKKKIALLTCIWERPHLTNFTLEYYKNLITDLKEIIDIIPICIGSEQSLSQKIAHQNDWIYLEHSNYPLSKKWGFGMMSTKKYQIDGVVTIGSDDIISKNTFSRYIEAINKKESLLGFYDIYFYSKKSALIHWHGYGYASEFNGMPRRLGETIGAGRFYSRSLLESTDYNPWKEMSINSGLDLAASKNLERLGFLKMKSKHRFNYIEKTNIKGQFGENLSDSNSLVLDIKTHLSLTSIDRYTLSKNCYGKIPDKKEFLLQHFDPETIKQIFQITTKYPN